MINKLYLKNFKCFQNQSVEFKNLTVLSGMNGTGKSSIIQAMLLLRQSFLRRLLSTEGMLALNGEYVQLGAARDILFEGAEEDVVGLGLNYGDGQELNWKFNYAQEADYLKMMPDTNLEARIFSSEALFSDNFHYLQAERIGPRPFYNASDYLVREHRQLGNRGEFVAHFLDKYGSNIVAYQNMLKKEAQSEQLKHQVEAWMHSISPGLRLNISSLGMEIIKMEYAFSYKRQVSKNFRPTHVGFGISYTLPVIVAILSSSPGSILLIENPESHLHPAGQAELGKLMALAAENGIQLVIETHSDHLINGIRVAIHDGLVQSSKVKLHFIERQEDADTMYSSIFSPELDRQGRLSYWPSGFLDQWEKSLDILLEDVEE